MEFDANFIRLAVVWLLPVSCESFRNNCLGFFQKGTWAGKLTFYLWTFLWCVFVRHSLGSSVEGQILPNETGYVVVYIGLWWFLFSLWNNEGNGRRLWSGRAAWHFFGVHDDEGYVKALVHRLKQFSSNLRVALRVQWGLVPVLDNVPRWLRCPVYNYSSAIFRRRAHGTGPF